MSTTTAARNRDAQLLWDYIEAHFEAGRVPSTDTRIMHDRLDVALATERRLTVEKALVGTRAGDPVTEPTTAAGPDEAYRKGWTAGYYEGQRAARQDASVLRDWDRMREARAHDSLVMVVGSQPDWLPSSAPPTLDLPDIEILTAVLDDVPSRIRDSLNYDGEAMAAWIIGQWAEYARLAQDRSQKPSE